LHAPLLHIEEGGWLNTKLGVDVSKQKNTFSSAGIRTLIVLPVAQ
jgi:hypothetical protein